MEKKKNLCAMIPKTLHTKVREEQEKQELTLSQYVEQVLKAVSYTHLTLPTIYSV